MTAKKIQLFETSPEQFIGDMMHEIDQRFASFKNEFQPKTPEDFLTRKEAKELLKIDLSTLWSWTKKGKLQAYGIGNRVYYKRSEIEENLTRINH